MSKKFSVFRILLIVFSALMIISFFAIPMATLNKKKLLEIANEDAAPEDQITSLDLSPLITETFSEVLSVNSGNLPSLDPPSFYSGFNLMRFYFRLGKVIRKASGSIFDENYLSLTLNAALGDSGFADRVTNPKPVKIFLLILIIICPLALAAACIFRKPGYIAGIIIGAFAFGISLYLAIGIFHISGIWTNVAEVVKSQVDEADISEVKDMIDGMFGCLHFNKLYLLSLLFPLGTVTVSILGLIFDRKRETAHEYTYTGGGLQDYGTDGAAGPDYFGGVMPAATGGLTAIGGEYEGAFFKMEHLDRVAIGRKAQDCNIILQDPSVSRVHCVVVFNGNEGEYSVTDSSTHGTFDGNGNRLPAQQARSLYPGDTIRIGNTDNVFILQ